MSASFREQFGTCTPEERVKGRLLVLHLKKGNQQLHSAAVYGAAGNEGHRIRCLMLGELSRAAPPSNKSLLFMAEDFNMVERAGQTHSATVEGGNFRRGRTSRRGTWPEPGSASTPLEQGVET